MIKYLYRCKWLNSFRVLLPLIHFLFGVMQLACNRHNGLSPMITIATKQQAHMAAQIEVKRLATRDSQNKLQNCIVQEWEDCPDISDAQRAKEVRENLKNCFTYAENINNYLGPHSLEDIGHPIKHHKTHLQLRMAQEWAESQEEDLINQIRKGYFCNKLRNTIAPGTLPILDSNIGDTYWGNTNASVSSVLLASMYATVNNGKNKENLDSMMAGAATYYPFLNANFKLEESMVSAYPFASPEGMLLFGEYQYGGHVYFPEQFLFAPEDCATAVGKATYLTESQLRELKEMGKHEKDDNKLESITRYKAITYLEGDVQDKQLQLIEPGDVYRVPGHMALIATKPDNKSNVLTLQFNGTLEAQSPKILGGGVESYNLIDQVKELGKANEKVAILRPDCDALSIHESTPLPDFLTRIETKYKELFPDGPTNKPGDCRIFFEECG